MLIIVKIVGIFTFRIMITFWTVIMFLKAELSVNPCSYPLISLYGPFCCEQVFLVIAIYLFQLHIKE